MVPYPRPKPSPLILYVEIVEEAPNRWAGCFVAPLLYNRSWLEDPQLMVKYDYLIAYEAVILLAGGVAQAIWSGERTADDAFRGAISHGGMDEKLKDTDGDLALILNAMDCLSKVTGGHYEPKDVAEPTYDLLLKHWPAVEALAAALVKTNRIEGDAVEAIIDDAMSVAHTTAFRQDPVPPAAEPFMSADSKPNLEFTEWLRAIESGLDDNLRIEGPAYLLAVKLYDAGTAWPTAQDRLWQIVTGRNRPTPEMKLILEEVYQLKLSIEESEDALSLEDANKVSDCINSLIFTLENPGC
jgi:hypothetical protein